MEFSSIIVRAEWDSEAKVWWASSTDIAGLAVEAPTQELLAEKVEAAISDLIELNGVDTTSPEIPVFIMSQKLTRVQNPRA